MADFKNTSEGRNLLRGKQLLLDLMQVCYLILDDHYDTPSDTYLYLHPHIGNLYSRLYENCYSLSTEIPYTNIVFRIQQDFQAIQEHLDGIFAVRGKIIGMTYLPLVDTLQRILRGDL